MRVAFPCVDVQSPVAAHSGLYHRPHVRPQRNETLQYLLRIEEYDRLPAGFTAPFQEPSVEPVLGFLLLLYVDRHTEEPLPILAEDLVCRRKEKQGRSQGRPYPGR